MNNVPLPKETVSKMRNLDHVRANLPFDERKVVEWAILKIERAARLLKPYADAHPEVLDWLADVEVRS